MFRLAGRVALVTGAGSGIGAAIADTLARAGAHVFATDCDIEAAIATADRIQADGGAASALPLDVVDESACADAASHVAADAGALDILVNNAGIGHVGTLLTTTGADLDRLYAVNVRGVFNVTKVFLPMMLERRQGSVIN